VDKDKINDWFNSWLDLYFSATDSVKKEKRQTLPNLETAQ